MIRFIAKYMLYIYLNFIKENYEIYKKWAITFIKITTFIRGIYIWIGSVIFFPFFVCGMIFDKNRKRILKNIKYII
jgi:hypothetical protein